MRLLTILLISLFSYAAIAQNNLPRVAHIFSGNSKAAAYQNFSKYKYTKDTRDSRTYDAYYLNENLLNNVRQSEGIWAVHAMVRNVALDGLCKSSQCFRVYIFINGDENGGYHVATFVVSPGRGRRTPTYNNAKLRHYTRSLYTYEKPSQYKDYDMYRIYGSKSYPGSIPNMPNAMFFAPAIALHGSFGRVDGNKRSHGCIRMFPDEAYWVQTLVRQADGNMTIDVLHTR